MDKITALFEKIDLTKLVPPLDPMLDKVQTVVTVALMVGPLLMLLFGLWYLLLPPKEANHSAGFRTWFGMGSVTAWRTTQKIAGVVWGGCGLVLSVVMWFISRSFGKLDAMQMAERAFSCLIWQIGIALITYVGISIVAMVLFDSKGRRRGKK